MGTPIDYDGLRTETVVQVAKFMAGAAITAPKSGRQLFLAGKHNFIETVIVEAPEDRHALADWCRARGKERREAIWFRDAVGSAAKTASIHSIDCCCQTRVAVAARKTDVIRADLAVALSLSMPQKSIEFDRRMPYPATTRLALMRGGF